MLKRNRFTPRTLLLVVMALFLILPSASLYAQDDSYDDDEYYDDCYDDYDDCEYYDDEYYDDYDCDDDCDYDDEYYDDYYDDFEGEEFDDEDVLARYEVDGTDLVGDPEDAHLQLWTNFTTLIPSNRIDGVITYLGAIQAVMSMAMTMIQQTLYWD